jgi:aldose 1-epimerase
VTFSPHWKAVSAGSDDSAAFVTSRLEFWRWPDYMAQFPFAHTIEMTHKLTGGSLEVHTSIANHAEESMPLSVAYHPYFTLADAPRDEWTVHLAARRHVVVDERLIPTGEQTPSDLPAEMTLAGRTFDDGFAGVDSSDEFRVRGRRQQIALRFGPKYPVAVVYAPPGRNFICFEPMTGVTNAFNLAHEGRYSQLQTIAPGETWSESFSITPSGY